MLQSAHVAIPDHPRRRHRDGRRTHPALPHVPRHDRAPLRCARLRASTSEASQAVDRSRTPRPSTASCVVRSTPHAACIVAGAGTPRSNGLTRSARSDFNRQCSSAAGASSSGCSSRAGPLPSPPLRGRVRRAAALLPRSARLSLGRRSAPALRLARARSRVLTLGTLVSAAPGPPSRRSAATGLPLRGARGPLRPAALQMPRAVAAQSSCACVPAASHHRLRALARVASSRARTGILRHTRPAPRSASRVARPSSLPRVARHPPGYKGIDCRAPCSKFRGAGLKKTSNSKDLGRACARPKQLTLRRFKFPGLFPLRCLGLQQLVEIPNQHITAPNSFFGHGEKQPGPGDKVGKILIRHGAFDAAPIDGKPAPRKRPSIALPKKNGVRRGVHIFMDTALPPS